MTSPAQTEDLPYRVGIGGCHPCSPFAVSVILAQILAICDIYNLGLFSEIGADNFRIVQHIIS